MCAELNNCRPVEKAATTLLDEVDFLLSSFSAIFRLSSDGISLFYNICKKKGDDLS